MKRILSSCAAGALVVGGSILTTQPAQAADPPSYSVMLLDLGGTDQRLASEALGVNDGSDVVGHTFGQGLYQGSTFWPSRSGKPALSQPALKFTDVAADGTILGQGTDGAVLIPSGSGLTEPLVAPDGLTTHAGHISANGVAVVTAGTPSSSPRAFTFTSPTDHTELLPPAGASNPSASGISDDGTTVAGSARYRNADVPVVWTDGVAKRLTAPAGATASRLNAVNDPGQAVGCSVVNGAERPYRYDAAGTPSALPVPQGSSSACATVVNNAGTIAGTAAIGGTTVAVVWLNGQLHNLNDLVHDRSGYTLTSVEDINATGQVVGRARLANGKERGYIATPSTAESIYTAPGNHHFNGRDWKTSCETYSVTSRCRTEIIATQVLWEDGVYKRVTGWAFNNLTYTPSPRAPWATNPLAETGEWTAYDGRKWRTECDTPATGKNGCRSYVQARVADATPKPGGGYAFTVTEKWVFNNIVKFS